MDLASTLSQLPRRTKKTILVIADAVLLPAALWLAFVSRMGEWSAVPLDASWMLVIVPIISIPIFIRIGLYRAVVRYIGDKALYTVLKGVTLAVSALFVITFIVAGHREIPWSVLGIFWAFAMLYIGGSRLLMREYLQKRQRLTAVKENIAIYGSGAAGVQLAIGLQSGREYNPVAFVDEKKDLIGTFVHGIRVYSPKELPQIIRERGIGQVLLAIPSASRARRKEILGQLESLPVHVRTIPGLADLVGGNAQVDDIQEVDIADLLGRDPVAPNPELLSRCIRGKSVMVTGAGGSIGSELCRQILQLRPTRLVLFESSEFALYSIEQELVAISSGDSSLRDIPIVPVLGSVTHRRRVESVIGSFGVQTIYHAAAYKHVPLVEHNPIEGVQNNLFGTWRIAEAALAAGVETFVLISTDKAVRPTNVMGATKRMAELVLQALADRKGSTRFCMVRFGNVLGSSGSVVPLFRRQIRQGGPVTVTHSEITRYFMTIPEAAQLVLQAGSMGAAGDVFVLDMGESVKIADLARRMIHLSGLRIKDADFPDGDIEVLYTGLRPGEKLYEELLIGDVVFGTEHPRIMRAQESKLPWARLSSILQALEQASFQFDSARIRQLLEDGVAGYAPQGDIVDPVWLTANGSGQDIANVVALPRMTESLS